MKRQTKALVLLSGPRWGGGSPPEADPRRSILTPTVYGLLCGKSHSSWLSSFIFLAMSKSSRMGCHHQARRLSSLPSTRMLAAD